MSRSRPIWSVGAGGDPMVPNRQCLCDQGRDLAVCTSSGGAGPDGLAGTRETESSSAPGSL